MVDNPGSFIWGRGRKAGGDWITSSLEQFNTWVEVDGEKWYRLKDSNLTGYWLKRRTRLRKYFHRVDPVDYAVYSIEGDDLARIHIGVAEGFEYADSDYAEYHIDDFVIIPEDWYAEQLIKELATKRQ